MTYTIKDLNDAVAEHGFGYPGWNSFWELETYENGSEGYESTALEGIGTVDIAEVVGGSEGGGEEHWIVVKVTDAAGDVRYFKRDGWYASYDGGSLDGPTTEVKPVERPKIYWEPIK
ncbi:hypothetical protein [Mycobacterium phage WXIN]|nr:hypothetical protein [Mycobacterium phage WXIN]